MSSDATPIQMEDNEGNEGAASEEPNPPGDKSNTQTAEQASEGDGEDISATNEPPKQDENTPSGYIARGLDPVGHYAQKGLSPIGYGVEKTIQPVTGLIGGITRPILGAVAGTREEKAEILGGEKKAEDFEKKPILTTGKDTGDGGFGGKDQTAENPLGL